MSLVVQWLKFCFLMQGLWVQFLVGKQRSHAPRGQNIKSQNRSNIVTNSIKTFKMVHIKKKNLMKKRNLLKMHQEAMVFWETQGTLPHPFLCIIPPLRLQMMLFQKGRERGDGSVLFLPALSHSSESWKQRELVECAMHQEVKQKQLS